MSIQNSIRNEYESFKERLDNTINNYPTPIYNPEDCYLVGYSFINKLDNYFKTMLIAPRYNKFYDLYNTSLNIEEPNIINDFNMMINYIKIDIK